MNVLFLLLTSVSAGDVVQAAPQASGPIVSTPIPGGCGAGGGCGATCDSCGTDCCAKPSFCERLKARFRRSSDCCETTCAPACTTCAPACTTCAPTYVAAPACTSCAPACAPTCTPACSTGSCGSVCDTCCEKKPGFWARLRARFHKSDCCPTTCDTCSTGCSTGCSNCAPGAPVPGATNGVIVPSTPAVPGKAIEPIKKMPKDEGKGAMMAPIVPVVPVTPAAARIETEVKNPF